MIYADDLTREMDEKGYRARDFCLNSVLDKLGKSASETLIDMVSGKIAGFNIIPTDLISFKDGARPMWGEGVVIYEKTREDSREVRIVKIHLDNNKDYRM